MKFNTPYGQVTANILTPHLDKRGVDFSFSEEDIKFVDRILKQVKEAEENVIKHVLAQLLQREPTFEDAMHVTRVFINGVTDRYTLAYRGIPLGIVEVPSGPMGYNYSVRFAPHPEYS